MCIKQSWNTFIKTCFVRLNYATGIESCDERIFTLVSEYIIIKTLLKVINCKEYIFTQSIKDVFQFIDIESNGFSFKNDCMHVNNGIA